MEFSDNLWLPHNPSRRKEREAKRLLHPELVQRLLVNVHKPALKTAIEEVSAIDLELELVELEPPEHFIPHDENVTYMDSYQARDEIKPTFAIDMHYSLKDRECRTDICSLTSDINIDPGTAAEAIAALPDTVLTVKGHIRTIVADLLISHFVNQHPFLRQFVTEAGRETADMLDLNDDVDDDECELLVRALHEMRDQITAGTYGVLCDIPEFDNADLTEKPFPQEFIRRKRRRNRRNRRGRGDE